MNKWPKVLHVCAKQPCRISEESIANTIKINDVHYRIKGLVHHRENGQMSVSVKRSGPGSWHELGKDSEPQQNGNKVALLSDVVLIQLVRASQDDPSPSSGLSASKYFLFYFTKKGEQRPEPPPREPTRDEISSTSGDNDGDDDGSKRSLSSLRIIRVTSTTMNASDFIKSLLQLV